MVGFDGSVLSEDEIEFVFKTKQIFRQIFLRHSYIAAPGVTRARQPVNRGPQPYATSVEGNMAAV